MTSHGKIIIGILLAGNIFLAAALFHRFIAGDTRGEVVTGMKAPLPSTCKTAGGRGVYFQLKNALFCWDDQVCIETDHLLVKSLPGEGIITEMDRPDSFSLEVCDGSVRIGIAVMGHLMNERIFGLEGSTVKDAVIDTVTEKGEILLRIRGKADYLFPMNFEMKGTISLDEKENVAIIRAKSLKALGLPFAGSMMNTLGITMEKLIKVPAGCGLVVKGDSFILNPFMLFRNPGVKGTVQAFSLGKGQIIARFKKEKAPPVPPKLATAQNDIFLFGGAVRIGTMLIEDSRIQIVDASPGDLFRFNLPKYRGQLADSIIRMRRDGSLLVSMPDSR